MKRINILLLALSAVILLSISIVTAGTCTITNYANTPWNSGQNVTITCGAMANSSNLYIRTNSGLQTIGSTADIEEDVASVGIYFTPDSVTGLTSGCGKILECDCRGNATLITATANDTGATSAFCLREYSSGDLPAVAVDNLGEGGFQFKIYMPLIILALALGLAVTLYLGIKRKV